MKEDVPEQIVDDYLQLGGYFTTHNGSLRYVTIRAMSGRPIQCLPTLMSSVRIRTVPEQSALWSSPLCKVALTRCESWASYEAIYPI